MIMETNEVKITVFTPAYNRAHLLRRLYDSLCAQTYTNFEWIIVDDGSTDNTETLIKEFIAENKIDIRFTRQPNGGKHRAINRGVSQATGELFYIVDSDDYLTPDALQTIIDVYTPVRNDTKFAGISALCHYSDGTKAGGEEDWLQIDSNALEIRLKYRVKGDLSEVFRTAVMREFPFPEFEGEKFCPEALVWNRIARKYNLRYVYRKIYVCDYQPDGLTANIIKVRRNSPLASALYYSEYTRMPVPLAQKLKGAINFHRFHNGGPSSINPILSLLGFIPGKLMRVRDSRKI